MSELDFKANEISIRGRTYRVRELSGAEMAEVRRLINHGEQHRSEPYVAWKCTLEPPVASEAAAMALPQIVVDKVSAEAFRLTKLDDPKEGEPAKNA
jgi:hypothetical protein